VREISELPNEFNLMLDRLSGTARRLDAEKNQSERAEAELAVLAQSMEQRVIERTTELDRANEELESFAYSIAHDLRAPLRGITGFSQIVLAQNEAKLDQESVNNLQRVVAAGKRMSLLIDDLLALSRISRREVQRGKLDLSAMATEIAAFLAQAHPKRSVRVSVRPDMHLDGDAGLMRIAMENLLGNAWKFSSRKDDAEIEVGSERRDGEEIYFVRDNGAGFDMKYVGQLFKPFQRLHGEKDFEGTGIGLSIVQRVVARHGGRIWAEAKEGEGATFYFSVAP
jgi:light-regulated signal transduction histidine kinase (bacteriophytochrome)